MTDTVTTEEPIGSLIMSGHCSFPVTSDPQSSHDRCARNGGGSRANPAKVFTPCPCPCHYGEEFECGGCGRPIREALMWPFDGDGDLRYTHVHPETGKALGEECGGKPPPKEEEEEEEAPPPPPKVKDCVRCGSEFTGNSSNGACPSCSAADAVEEDDFADLAFDDDEDDFADLLED